MLAHVNSQYMITQFTQMLMNSEDYVSVLLSPPRVLLSPSRVLLSPSREQFDRLGDINTKTCSFLTYLLFLRQMDSLTS